MKGKKNPETFGGKWRYLFMILALVFSVGVSAQKTVVKGNILDRDNLPVIGANILEKGTTNGTISDVDGNFTLFNVPSSAKSLVVSFIGMKSAEVAVKPEVKLGEYKGLKVDKYSTRVTQKEVDEEIEKVREQHARIVEVTDRAVADKDDVTLDFEGFVDGVAFEGGKDQNHSLELGSKQFIPGFEEQLVGAKAGDEIDVNVVFPVEYHAPNLAGKAAMFKVTINDVKRKEMPTLDDEFVKDVSAFNTVEELKADIKANLLTFLLTFFSKDFGFGPNVTPPPTI